MPDKDNKLTIERCSDIELLSRLFRELAEDERSDVKRTEEDYREEMSKLLGRGELAYLFTTAKGGPAGYALVDPFRKPYYLRHFYICRGHRLKGYGKAAFRLLLDALKISEIDLDVFDWNERGKAFWNSLGFKPRAIIMRYSSDKP
ncbi:MAG: N-acetyltransferase family protein [Burkholderiales bacterium]